MSNALGLNSLKPNDKFEGVVKIVKKSKPGPVVFIVTNGTGAIEAVTKESDFNIGDVVYIEGTVNEHRERLQIELAKITPSEYDFDTILSEKSNPPRTTFSIESKRYETMKDVMIRIAKRIRQAVLEGQPIMIRHHNDADGITSGLSIEHACLGFMESMGLDSRYSLFRSPSKAPFYASGDVLRDLVLSKRFVENDSNLKPLIIVLDNGSTMEDKMGLQTLKILGYEAIVIDHHNPVVLHDGITGVDEYLIDHLNPYKFGLDSKTSAGMLCYELARFIYEGFDQKLFPAVAGIADRCEIEETEKYIMLTTKDRKELGKIGTAIDYISYQLKHDAGKGVYEELFQNSDFVDLINEEVTRGFESQLQSTLPYLRTQNINSIVFSTIDIEKYTMRFSYPPPGNVLSRIHEIVNKDYDENLPIITIGYLTDMFIVRASQPILPVQKIIEKLQTDFPTANVDGGGHEMAGAIRFVSAHRDELLEGVKNMFKELSTTTN